MNAQTAAELTELLRQAVFWAKIVCGCISLSVIEVLFWAWTVRRILDDLKAWQVRHDDTLYDLKSSRDNFSGLFKTLRKIERALLDLFYHVRKPR